MLEQESDIVHTVLGPIVAQELGGVLIHESLFSVESGAELAPEKLLVHNPANILTRRESALA